MSKKRSVWKNTPEGKTVRRNTLATQWQSRPIELLESPALRVPSRAAHLALLRIEIELRRHAGRGNGKLIVTKEQFVEYMRVHPRLIAPALRELEALGLICIDHGRGGNGEHRQPNRFLLNYLCGAVDAHELITNSWKQFKTLEEAAKVAAEARKAKDVAKVNYGRRNAAHKNISRGHLVYLTPRTLSVPESPKLPGTLGVPTAPGPLSVPTSDISGGGGAKGGWSLKKRRAAEAAPAHTRFGGNAGPPLLEWTTPTLTEIACTDELRQLYAATEPVPAIDLLKLSRGVVATSCIDLSLAKESN